MKASFNEKNEINNMNKKKKKQYVKALSLRRYKGEGVLNTQYSRRDLDLWSFERHTKQTVVIQMDEKVSFNKIKDST